MKIKRVLKKAGKFLESALTEAPKNEQLTPNLQKFRPKSFSNIEEERLYAGVLAKKVFLPVQKATNTLKGKNKKLSSYQLKRKAVKSEQGVKRIYNDTGNVIADAAEKVPRMTGIAAVNPGAAAEIAVAQGIVAPATKVASGMALASGEPVLQSVGGYMLAPVISAPVSPANWMTIHSLKRIKNTKLNTPAKRAAYRRGFRVGEKYVAEPAQKLRGKSIKNSVDKVRQIPGRVSSVLSLPTSPNVYPRPVLA